MLIKSIYDSESAYIVDELCKIGSYSKLGFMKMLSYVTQLVPLISCQIFHGAKLLYLISPVDWYHLICH